jgi:site-specific DNA recombinase
MRKRTARTGAATAAPAAPQAGSPVSGPNGPRTAPRSADPQGLRLIGYCRVSTAAQAERGVSLDEQRERIRQYARAHGYALVDFETDAGASGKSLARNAFQRALRRLQRGEADGLVAVKLDRFSRSIRDVVELVGRADRQGWSLHSLGEKLDTSSAIGRFAVHLFGALAELERAQIGERTRSALDELCRQGRRVSGKPPFGYAFRDGRIVEEPGEQRILARILELRGDGLGAKAIARALNETGSRNPRTTASWSHGTIGHVLKRLSPVG